VRRRRELRVLPEHARVVLDVPHGRVHRAVRGLDRADLAVELGDLRLEVRDGRDNVVVVPHWPKNGKKSNSENSGGMGLQ